jgi:hypothetical protein
MAIILIKKVIMAYQKKNNNKIMAYQEILLRV